MIAGLLRPQKPKLIDVLDSESLALASYTNGVPAASPLFDQQNAKPIQSPVHRSIMDDNALVQWVRTLGDGLAAHLPVVYQEQGALLMDEVKRVLLTLDDQWQRIVEQHIDPLFGSTRSRQFADLGIGLSAAEKDMNRRLILAVGNIGIALMAEQLFLPLALVNIGFSAWLIRPIIERGVRTLMKEKRLTYPLVILSTELVTYLHGFFVPGSVVILLVTVTNKLINRTEHHFRRELASALGEQPHSVWVLIDGNEVEVPFAGLQMGDQVVVGAGEIVPVDGVVTGGTATIDQHKLTGEAQPAEKGVGDIVLASTIVLAGKVYVRVEKTGAATSAAQIAAALQRAAGFRLSFTSRVQNFVDGMTAPMLALGGVAWFILGGQAAAAILGAGVGSVARFGGPMAMLNYLNIASHQGLLIKDARSLEKLKGVNTVVFDKTGTLTIEQPQVHQIHICGDLSAAEVLTLAASAEVKQSHPVAKALLTAAQEEGYTLPVIDDARYEMGYGIQVTVGGQIVRVGSSRYLEMEEIVIPAPIQAVQAACHELGHSLVLVAVDDVAVGAIELRPTIRPEARAAIAELHRLGLELYIISGDHEAPTRQLAQQLGIDHYFAGVLPQNKAALVEELKAQGRTVCFVGDGINDALALGKADVSISLRGATTIATDTAQIVLMNQDLSQIAFLLQVSREFDATLERLFRVALVPAGVITASTFILHTGIYTSIVIWQLGVLGGVGIALFPLVKYRTKPLQPVQQTLMQSLIQEEV